MLVSRSRCQVPVSRRVSMARHAPALRPDPGTAFLEPKPQVALITVAVCASSYDTIHYCYKQHQECSSSALLCTLRAATKRLNGITTKRNLNDVREKPMEKQNHRLTSERRSTLRFRQLTCVSTPICLCKSSSCKACPRITELLTS